MRKAKEILKDRKNIEEKLTQSEIEFNKINYKKAQEKLIIKKLEKDRELSTKDGISTLNSKLEKRELSLEEHTNKLKNIKKKKYKDKKKKRSYIFAERKKIKRRKKQINKLKSKITKYSKMSPSDLKKQINIHEDKIEKLTPELNKRKLIVNENKKQYKILWKEWTDLHPEIADENVIVIKNLNIFYGKKQSIHNVSMEIPKKQVISIIGPSGCGKSTLLKTINRINDQIPNFKAEGKILLDNEMDILALKNIYDESDTITLPQLRTKVGMVFQQPNPFPMSIYNNVAYGPRINGIKNKSIIKEIVHQSLKKAAIYDEVKDNLGLVATGLSGGQQQRLCIARAIANEPSILLMDEPTSALDPIAAKKVEDLILELKKDYTIILVTHSMQQAQRISDYTAFMYQGELIEYGPTKQIFKNPKLKKTKEYLGGKFG